MEQDDQEIKRRTAQNLISKLSSVSDQTRITALCELRLLSKTDPTIRPIIADEGAIPYLADTLYSATPLSQENAAATILNLSITRSSREALMSTRGLLDALSHALSHHTRHHPSAVSAAAATVHSLLVNDVTYRPIIGSKRDIIYALVDIIKCRDSPSRVVKDGLKALFGLALYPSNRFSMVELGVVGALFGVVVRDGRGVGVVEDSTAVIAQVAGCRESLAEFRRVKGVRVLVDLIDLGTGSSSRIRENVVSALLNLVKSCGDDDDHENVRENVVVEEIRELLGLGLGFEGLREVRENGSVKGRKRAEELINLLEDGNGNVEEDSCSSSGLDSGPLLDSRSY